MADLSPSPSNSSQNDDVDNDGTPVLANDPSLTTTMPSRTVSAGHPAPESESPGGGRDVDVDVGPKSPPPFLADIERGQQRRRARPDPPGSLQIRGKHSFDQEEEQLSTKPTWEGDSSSGSDDDDEGSKAADEQRRRHPPGGGTTGSAVDTTPINLAAATAAAVAAVSAISSSAPPPVATPQNQRAGGVQFESSFVDDDAVIKPPRGRNAANLSVDTRLPPPPDGEAMKKKKGRAGGGERNPPSVPLPSPADSTVAPTEPPTPANSTVTIEHRVNNKQKNNRSASGSAARSLLFGMKKPVLALLGVYLLGVTGLSAFLAQQYLTIPGLNAQIEELGQEVDRLEVQVDRLEKENDRFELLNDELESNVEEYTLQNDRLEMSNAYYAELNTMLNASNAELERLNGALNASNVEYARLNGELSATTRELANQVDFLEVMNVNLTDTLYEYILLSEGLTNETDRLDRLNDDLSRNVLNLNGTLSDLRDENGRLTLLLDDLTVVTSFLNETSQDLERSYEVLADYLAEQIVANREILSETVHNTYRQRTTGWVCGFEMRYATEPFGSDGSEPIPSNLYPEVMDYVDDNVLEDLCLDSDDFEVFLSERMNQGGAVPPTGVTTNDLIPAVMMYTTDTMDYYFPDEGEVGGLTETDWSDANYRCENLPPEKHFLSEKAL